MSFKHGLEAVPREPRNPQGDWLVRPVHPDGFGYAAISRPIPQELAQLWARAPELKRCIVDGLASFDRDPAETDHHRGYLAALQELNRILTDEA